MLTNNSNTFIVWAIVLLIFGGLCLQLRSCALSALDSTPRQQSSPSSQTPTPETSQPPSQAESEVAPVETPTPTPLPVIQPSIKLVDNNEWRVVIGKQPTFYDTNLHIDGKTVLNCNCEPTGAKVEFLFGTRRVFFTCYGLGYYPEFFFHEGRGYEPSFSSTIKVRVFDETEAPKVTFIMRVNPTN